MVSRTTKASQRNNGRARWIPSVIQMLETRRLLSAVPTDITLDISEVAENQSSGTQVGTFATIDDSASFTYALVDGIGADDNGLFSITDGVLSTAAAFDFETQNVFHIRVSSYDGDSTPFEKEFTITVTNVDESPTDISLDNSTVAENQPAGTLVGNLTTSDVDSTDFTYSLVEGIGSADNALFQIVGGELQTAAGFDFEAQSVFYIRVSSSDGVSTPFEKEFIITVTDVDESPTDISLDNSTVAENQPAGTLVGNLTTTDVDSTDFTYSLVEGIGSADNALFQIVNGELQTAAGLNYDAQTTYYIRIRSEQTGDSSLYTEKEFVISATDVDDRVAVLVNGTAGADSISVNVDGVLTNQYNIDVNGTVTNYWIGEVLSLDVLGGDGNDSIILGGGIQAATLNGGYGDDSITSSDGDDFIRGEDGNDVIRGLGGADTIYGNTGNDDIDAGSGNDSVLAGLGADTVVGASGHDMIYTGDGMDWISGDQGNDYIEGPRQG